MNPLARAFTRAASAGLSSILGTSALDARYGMDPGAMYQQSGVISTGNTARRRSLQNSTISELDRTLPPVNEFLWLRNSVVFTGVSTYNRMTVNSGYELFSDDLETQMAIQRFFGRMPSDHRRHFDRVALHYNSMHLAVNGNTFIEKIMGRLLGQKVIHNIAAVDFKTMDFKRESGGFMSGDTVRYDFLGRPVGWVQSVLAEEVEFDRNQMQHNSIHQLHEGHFGIGFPEALVDKVSLILNTEHAKAELAFNLANPKIMLKYGTPLRRPSLDMKQIAISIGDDMSDERVSRVAYPDWMDIQPWNTTDKATIDDSFLRLLIEMVAGVFGIPSAVLLQSSEGMSRSGFENMMQHFQLTFLEFQKNLGLDRLMEDILRFNHEPHQDIQVRFGPLSNRILDQETSWFLRLAKTRVLPEGDPQVIARAKELAGIIDGEVPQIGGSRQVPAATV